MNMKNLHAGLRIHAENKPNKVAVVYDGQRRTFLELYERTNALANSLIELGVKKGDRVVLYMRNRLEMMEILYALSVAGAVAVPINYMVEGNDLVKIANESEAKHAFVEIEKKDAFDHVLDQLQMIHADSTILVGGKDQHLFWDYEDLISKGSKEQPQVEVELDDQAAILYSSGTTSLPKGIVITQRNTMYRCVSTSIEWNFNYNDTILISVPIYHGVGNMFNFYLGVLGCKMVITREFNPENTLKIMQDEGVTASFFVPTQYILMLQVPSFEQYDLSSLKLLVSGAAPLAEATKKQILHRFGCNLTEFLGTSEAGAFTCLRPSDVIRKTASVGQRADFMEVRLVSDEGIGVGVGEEGEFAIRGPALFSGYYKNPEETQRAFLPNGWHRTGDMGKVDEEGYYYLLDRKKDMVISGGVNIYPKDIEEILYTHPAVLEAAVIGVADEKWGEKVKAFVVLKQGMDVDAASLIAECNQKLAKFQHIKELEFIHTLPRNPSGKILKRELRLR